MFSNLVCLWLATSAIGMHIFSTVPEIGSVLLIRYWNTKIIRQMQSFKQPYEANWIQVLLSSLLPTVFKPLWTQTRSFVDFFLWHNFFHWSNIRWFLMKEELYASLVVLVDANWCATSLLCRDRSSLTAQRHSFSRKTASSRRWLMGAATKTRYIQSPIDGRRLDGYLRLGPRAVANLSRMWLCSRVSREMEKLYRYPSRYRVWFYRCFIIWLYISSAI